MEYEYIGAIKIKDGLFLGDQFAAQDLEFVVTNKVTRIINCAGKQIPNHWESIGIAYLTFSWLDNDTQVIFDQKDEVLNQCYKFLEDALNQGESVIIHSVRGHNRSVCVLCLYFMKKFRWTLYKTLQYLHSRRPDLEIRANFFNQLLSLESKFQKQGFGAKTYNWEEIFEEGEDKGEELLLRNTYLNAQAQGVADFKDHDTKPKQNKIKWLDSDGKVQKLVSMSVPAYENIDFTKRPKPKISKSSSVKSIVKVHDPSKITQKSEAKELTLKSDTIQEITQSTLPVVNSLKELKVMDKKIVVHIKKENNEEQQILQTANLPNKVIPQKPLKLLQENTDDPISQNLFNKIGQNKFLAQTTKIQQIPVNNQKQFSQTYQVNNFVNSADQWYKPPKTSKKNEFTNFEQLKGRPSTAPQNTIKAGALPSTQFRQIKQQQNTEGMILKNKKDLMITPYKRQSSLGSRAENNIQPQGQFRPQGNRQRGFSPQNVYSNNPYAQKSFKPWKK